MRHIVTRTFLGILLSICFASVAYSADKNSPSPSHKVIAEVNGEKIYQSSVDTIIMDLQRSGSDLNQEMQQRLIDRLIEQKIIAQSARTQQYHLRPNVQHQIQVMTEMVLKENYLADLVGQNVTPEAIKAEFDAQMQKYTPIYEYKAAHILLKDVVEAKKVKEEINQGADFSQMAKQYSSDSNANIGGDLGYFTQEMMVKPFSDTVIKMTKGAISDPVETDFGWHIIQLNDKRALAKPTLKDKSQQIEVNLSRKIMADHLEMLKKQAHIKLYTE